MAKSTKNINASNSTTDKVISNSVEVEEAKENNKKEEEKSVIEQLQEQLRSQAALMEKMKADFESLKNSKEEDVKPSSSLEGDVLNALINRKSDREVIIVHNRENSGGITTDLKLDNALIQFHKLGEQRVISWYQFEECVSKYRKLFDKEIILLGSGQEDLEEKYVIKGLNRGTDRILTKELLETVGTLENKELEDLFNDLSQGDKTSLLCFWMGKCYETDKDSNYFNRYKLELFNRLTNSNIFGNIIRELDSSNN